MACQLWGATKQVWGDGQTPALQRQQLGGVIGRTLHHLKCSEHQALTAGHLAAQGRSRCALATIEAVELTTDLHTYRCAESGRHGGNQGQQVHRVRAAACPRGREQAKAVLQSNGAPVELRGHREAASSGSTKTRQPLAQFLFVQAQ